MEWRPYVPVAVRHARARREMNRLRKKGRNIQPVEIEGRTIARSFWGKRWCDHLESFSDYANRLPRGRTYVRNGSVCHLEVHPGRIGAIVMGSELYDVTIRIGKLKAAVWKSIKHRCSGQIGSVLELLQGKLSRQVMGVVTDREHGLFPKPGEIRFDCSCPDWATMCKHVAAALYGVGSRLDDHPESLFLLRGVDSAELVATGMALPGDAATDGALADDALAGIFGIDLDLDPGDAPPPAPMASAKPRKPARRRAAPASGRAGAAGREGSGRRGVRGERPEGGVERRPQGEDEDLCGCHAPETHRRQGRGRPRLHGVGRTRPESSVERHPQGEDLSGRHAPETRLRQDARRRFTVRYPPHRKMGGPVASAVRPLRGPIRRTARRVGGDGVSLGSHARAAQPAYAPVERSGVPVPAIREVGGVISRNPDPGDLHIASPGLTGAACERAETA